MFFGDTIPSPLLWSGKSASYRTWTISRTPCPGLSCIHFILHTTTCSHFQKGTRDHVVSRLKPRGVQNPREMPHHETQIPSLATQPPPRFPGDSVLCFLWPQVRCDCLPLDCKPLPPGAMMHSHLLLRGSPLSEVLSTLSQPAFSSSSTGAQL